MRWFGAVADDERFRAEEKNNKPAVIDTKPTGLVTAALPKAGAVSLKCEPYNHSDIAAEVNVTNNTGQKLPAGTKIFWKTNKGAKGDFNVPSGGMAPNAVLMGQGGDWQDNGPCTAYYIKK